MADNGGLVAPPPESCPGTEGENAGKASACAGCPNQKICSSGAAKPVSQDPDIPLITKRLQDVTHKVLVLSGKGGVGKSTFSAQLSYGLAARFKEVDSLPLLNFSNQTYPRDITSRCSDVIAHVDWLGTRYGG
jgi:hypothetical protein